MKKGNGLFSQYAGLRKELYVLFIGRMMTNMGSMVWPMFTLILSQKLGLSASTIALCMFVYSIVAIPASIIGGRLADRLNKRNIIVVCDIVSISGFIYCAMVPMSISAMIVFAASGLFQSIEGPAYEALVADFTTSEDRDRAYSLSYLGNNLGLVLSPTIAGFLFNNHLNLAFLINGLSIMSSTILIALMIKDVHREKDESPTSSYEADIDAKTPVLKYLKGNRVILMYILISVLSGTVYNMWNFIMPMDMSALHGETGSLIYGTMTSVNCIEVVLLTAIVTKLVRKLVNTTKMQIGESLILLGYLIFMFLAKSVAFCYVSIFIFTLGEILNTISNSPFMSRRIPASHRGRISSVYMVYSSLVSSVLQLLIGKVYDVGGSKATWAVVVAIGCVFLALFSIMKGMDRKDYPQLYSNKA